MSDEHDPSILVQVLGAAALGTASVLGHHVFDSKPPKSRPSAVESRPTSGSGTTDETGGGGSDIGPVRPPADRSDDGVGDRSDPANFENELRRTGH